MSRIQVILSSIGTLFLNQNWRKASIAHYFPEKWDRTGLDANNLIGGSADLIPYKYLLIPKYPLDKLLGSSINQKRNLHFRVLTYMFDSSSCGMGLLCIQK
jgi:hypothetical protein